MRTQLLMGSGIAASAARHITGNTQSAVTATGTTQADAFLLIDNNEFTTVASGAGAVIPANLDRGDTIFVYNGGANALLVYPPVGESINALSANTSISVATNKAILFTKMSATRWVSMLTA